MKKLVNTHNRVRNPSPKLHPKPTAAPKPATVKPQIQVTTAFNTVADKYNPPKWVVTTDPTTSPLWAISDHLDNLPLETFFELTRWLLKYISSLPKGAARHRAFLKTVIFFVAEYGSTS
jgi:hypothetical protein